MKLIVCSLLIAASSSYALTIPCADMPFIPIPGDAVCINPAIATPNTTYLFGDTINSTTSYAFLALDSLMPNGLINSTIGYLDGDSTVQVRINSEAWVMFGHIQMTPLPANSIINIQLSVGPPAWIAQLTTPVNPVPEPATWLLLLPLLIASALYLKRSHIAHKL